MTERPPLDQATTGTGAPEAPGRRRPWRAAPLLVLAAALLAGCNYPSFMALTPATVQGGHTYDLWSGMVIAALVVGVFVLSLILWAAFRYRRPKNDDGSLPAQTHHRFWWEVAYTAAPFVVVLGVLVFTIYTENEVDALPPAAVNVHVIAYRWGWTFDYTGTRVSIHTTSAGYPQLVIPEGEDTKVTLNSLDVVHEFMVPQFLFGRYAQPGITNQFVFTPTRTGVFVGHCAVYCGLYHAEMLFSVRVVPPAVYTSWLQSQEAHAA